MRTGSTNRSRFNPKPLPKAIGVLLVFAVVLVIVSVACAGPPQAQLTASVTSGQAPLSVSFTNQSKNADESRWDFGDGATAITPKETNTIHEYTKAGAYAVTLTAVKKGEPPQTSTATIRITVEPGPLDRVKIEPPVATLEVTTELKFTPTALDRFANPILGLNYTFRSDDKAGKVDPEGRFTAGTRAGSYESGLTVEVAQGSATQAASVKVTVKPGSLERVTIDPGEATVEVTKEQKFTATAVDRFGNPIPDLSYTFGSDKGAGQVTSEGGLTTGTKAGVYPNGVTAAATQGSVSKTATAAITVRPGPLDAVKLAPASAIVEVGKNQQFRAVAEDRYGNPIRNARVTYSLADKLGTIDSNGLLTAGTKAGTFGQSVKAVAVLGNISKEATASVTLKPGPLDRVLPSPVTVKLDIGKSQQFRAQAVDAYSNPAPEAKITWSVDDKVGAIDDKGLLTTGTKAGTFNQGVKATAVLGNISKETTASVTVKPDPLHEISLAPVKVVAGETQKLEPSVTDKYDNPLGKPEGVQLTTTAGDANAGSFTPEGLFTSGRVARNFPNALEVKATQGNVTRSATVGVAVLPGPLDQVFIAPNPANIGMEMTQQFVAVGADGFGNRIPGLAFTWIGEGGGGTIDARGLFTAGTRPGTYNNTVKATATQAGTTVSATATVTVEPDRIAFVSDRNDKQRDMYTMNMDGTSIQRLTNSQARSVQVSWSPDGRRIVSDSCVVVGTIVGPCRIGARSDDGIWAIALSDKDDGVPSWSPDGKKIVFASNRDRNLEIYVMDIDGGKQIRLTDNKTRDSWPAWSPDGKKIVFESNRDENLEIYVMDADGKNQTRLTHNPSREAIPTWAPDGSKILFQSDRDGDWEIYTMNPNGTDERQLTSNNAFDGNAFWSPDGKQILFNSTRDVKNDQIYVMNADGTNVRRLTTNTSDDFSARWAPPKRGAEVSEATVVIPNASALKPTSPQEVTAKSRAAVVRIRTDLGSGPGFILESNGLVLTNNHVISDAKEITVFLEDGRSFKAAVQGRDLVRDLAVVKIEASGLPTVELGDVSQLQLGSNVVVLGYPLGLTGLTLTTGRASGVKYVPSLNTGMVQTDSTINPGNSGGPLLNFQGQVVGVITFKIRGAEGFGLAISANTVKLYLDRLKAGQVIAN